MSGALAVGGFGFIPRAGSAPLFAETALGGVVGFAASATGSAGFASTGGGDGCTGTSATGSTGFDSGEGADCCDSPHPTSTKAAIVVSSMCFISLQLLILQLSCRRACGGGWRLLYVMTRALHPELFLSISRHYLELCIWILIYVYLIWHLRLLLH